MHKRKRDSELSSTSDRALDIKISRLKVRIDQGTSQLKKALHLARGFERQKLGRRQKAASNEPRELLRLREEVIVLKQLDLGIVAERQLLKRLGKAKRIAEHQAWKHVYGGKDVDGPKNDAEANVIGRLMNSNPVKESLPGVIESVFDVLGIESLASKSNADKPNGKEGVEFSTLEANKAPENQLTRQDHEGWSGSESDLEEDMVIDDGDVHEEESHDDVDTHLSGFNEESDTGGPGDRYSFNHNPNGGRPEPQLSTSRSSSPKSVKVPRPSKKDEGKLAPQFSNLPAIVGGYYSGSESASDLEDERNKPRKNRRGQRERQQIAEKKFGAKAKHLAKQVGGRDAGWDAKRGATDGKINSKGSTRTGRPSNVKGPTGANGDILGSRKKDSAREEPMHPSWEAAKKRKDQDRISLNTVAGMNKKITFD